MYESFFGLNGLPFKITPDDRIFYGGAQRQEVLDALIYTVERSEGLITIIGEVGTGKTTIARVLAKRLPEDVSIASIYMPNVQPLDMLYMIAQELNLTIAPHQPKYVVLEAVREYLLKQHEQGQRILLVIDEAQSMPLETLEELRLLSNMQTDDFKLLQIMLFGQQELQQILNQPSVRQVKDRIVYHLDLTPFSLDELADYLEFRMRMVGYRGERFFADDVVQAIYQATQGFPRAVNKLADHVLMSAFAEQSPQVLLRHVSAPVSAMSIQIREHSPSLFNQIREYYVRFLAVLRSSLIVQVMFGVIGLVILVSLFVFVFSVDKVAVQSGDDSHSDVVLQQVSPENITPPSELPTVAAQSGNEQRLQRESLDITANVSNATKTIPLANQQVPIKSFETEIKANVKHYPLSYWQDNHRKTLELLNDLSSTGGYSLQLMSDPWRLRDEFSAVAHGVTSRLEKNDVFYINYVLPDGRPRIALLYGVYHTREAAQAALEGLPDFAKSFAPVVVALKSVSKQMSLSTALQMEP